MDNVILLLKKNGELHLDILVDINLDFIVMCSGNLGSWLPEWDTNTNTRPTPPQEWNLLSNCGSNTLTYNEAIWTFSFIGSCYNIARNEMLPK